MAALAARSPVLFCADFVLAKHHKGLYDIYSQTLSRSNHVLVLDCSLLTCSGYKSSVSSVETIVIVSLAFHLALWDLQALTFSLTPSPCQLKAGKHK
jgi:hypothetical protein